MLKMATFHKDVETIGLRNFYDLRRIYSDIIGLKYIDHFTINIESPDGVLTLLPYNPAIYISLRKSGLIRYDGNLSPSVYRNNDLFVWDKAYVPRFANDIKKIKEHRFNIQAGVVLVNKIDGFHIMYSFASKNNGTALIEAITHSREDFLFMGNHCYSYIRKIYNRHLTHYCAPTLPKKPKIQTCSSYVHSDQQSNVVVPIGSIRERRSEDK